MAQMKTPKSIVACLFAGVLIAHANPLLYQTGFPNTVGQPLAGQGGWTKTGGGVGPIVSAGNLSMTGFAAPTGNSIAITPGNAAIVGQSIPNQTGDTWMSFMFRVNSLGSLDSTGTPLAGFVDDSGNEVGLISLRTDGSNFDIGGSITPTSSFGWNTDGTGWTVGATFLVVEQYSIRGDYDVLNGWIFQDGTVVPWWGTNPLGSAIQVASYNGTTGVDGVFISSDPTSANVTLDEVRVGTTWADVTPVATPDTGDTALLLVLSLSTIVCLVPSRCKRAMPL